MTKPRNLVAYLLPALVVAYAIGFNYGFGPHATISFAMDMIALVALAIIAGHLFAARSIRQAEIRRARAIAAELMTHPPMPEPLRHLRQSPPIVFGTLNDLLGPLAAGMNGHSLDQIHGVRMWEDRAEIVQCSPICIVAQDLSRLRARTAASNAAIAEDTMRLPAIRPMDARSRYPLEILERNAKYGKDQ